MKIPKTPEKNDIIWRYISLDKFIDILISGKIKFTPVSIAADKNEISLIINSLMKSSNYKNNPNLLESAKFFIETIRSQTYISCWTRKEHESRSLWANYLDSTKQGVAIKSTVGNFLDSIDWNGNFCDYKIIDYRNEFDDDEIQNNTIIINTKSTAYREETEIRFSINALNDIKSNSSIEHFKKTEEFRMNPGLRKNTIDFKINFESFISEIFISPYCSKWQRENIVQLIKDYRPIILNRISNSIVNEKNN